MRFPAYILVALLLAFVPGCSHAPTSPVLAKVGDREITVEDFQQEVAYRQKMQQVLPERSALLEQMITREVTLQKARAAGFEKDPGIRRSYEDMLASKLKETQLLPKVDAITVPTEEMRAIYQKDIARYTKPAKVQMALIYIKTERTTKPEQLTEIAARMNAARAEALALPALDKGFGPVAVKYSEDQSSRYRGGNVGWYDQGVTNYHWPAEIIAKAFSLQTNEVSDVLKARDGYYLVARLDQRPSSVTPFESIRPGIERRLLAEKKQQAEIAYQQQLRNSISVHTDPQALNAVDYRTQTMAQAVEPLPPGLPRTQ